VLLHKDPSTSYNAIMRQYEADFYQWTQETARHLRCGEFKKIEVSALLEEVEDLGKRERSALQSRLAVLLSHLLKWDHQPAKRSKSWQATIELQRTRIERLLTQSPSLRSFLSESLSESYADAVLVAIKQTGLDRSAFPTACPYSIEEVLKDKDVSVHC
jgi:hypothetical protein